MRAANQEPAEAGVGGAVVDLSEGPAGELAQVQRPVVEIEYPVARHGSARSQAAAS